MSHYSYTLNRGAIKKEQHRYYSRTELELMTTYQLREICRQEKIINGLHSALEKEELIHQIMRFRGREDRLLITRKNPEGLDRLEKLIQTAKLNCITGTIRGCAKLIAYRGIEMECFDRFTIGYLPEIEETNALLVSGGTVCAVFNIRRYRKADGLLYITKSADLDCRESPVRDYSLYCMGRAQSDLIYRVYSDAAAAMPEHLNFYSLPVLSFEVRDLRESRMPLAIDFGTSNTTAGMYLDSAYWEELEGDPIAEILKQNAINYVRYLNPGKNNEATPILPSVVGITGVNGGKVNYVFGHQADRLFHMSYIDEGFCVFYDIKRWVSDPEKSEEIVDRNGHRSFVSRREIIKAFLEYVIECARQRFKCNIRKIHISSPVRQKPLFISLFRKILPDYELEQENMLDEGVAVLYNSISELIERKKFQNGLEYRALIIDCGGGTTDLSSCRFKINNQRVAYKIDISTSYENGDTDFGGNNLTYRVMQFLKISLARQFDEAERSTPEELIADFDADVYREVDESGTDAVYAGWDEAYSRAESIIPTQFKKYEHSSRNDYYAVKNNFYFLFGLAEKIKKKFYGSGDVLRLAVSSAEIHETATACLLTDRWKLSVRDAGILRIVKDIPTVYLSVKELNSLLKADIYGIVEQFIGTLYESGELQEFSMIRLTGQSCKIDLFRDALKEFIPGRIIESSHRSQEENRTDELKLVCLNGAVKYLKDVKFGYADVHITHEQAAFPYLVTAFTHTGEEKVLIHCLDRKNIRGFISRNMADLTLKLFLKDPEGRVRYDYSCSFNPKDFKDIKAEEIVEKYAGQIVQDDIDDIVDRELKFFVFADDRRWGFTVVPVQRCNEQLQLGQDQFFLFEKEGWVTNFFDGTK